VSAELKDKVNAAIAEANEALKGTDIGAIKSAIEKLSEQSQEMGQAIYAAAQADAATVADDADAGAGADDVVDAEVVDEDKK